MWVRYSECRYTVRDATMSRASPMSLARRSECGRVPHASFGVRVRHPGCGCAVRAARVAHAARCVCVNHSGCRYTSEGPCDTFGVNRLGRG